MSTENENSVSDFKLNESSSINYALTSSKANFASLMSNADQKANIIIAITSLLFTFIVGQIGNLEFGYQIALAILMLFSVISLLLAIISVSPNYRQRSQRSKQTPSSELNKFFFGHFADKSFEEYHQEMKPILSNSEELYKEMLRDIYQMGVVLHKEKFKLLFYAYRFFFAGLVLSCLITLFVLLSGMGVST